MTVTVTEFKGLDPTRASVDSIADRAGTGAGESGLAILLPGFVGHCQVNVDHSHVWCFRDAERVRPLPQCSTQRTHASAEVADGRHGADVVQC
jgi:hypothetical protein